MDEMMFYDLAERWRFHVETVRAAFEAAARVVDDDAYMAMDPEACWADAWAAARAEITPVDDDREAGNLADSIIVLLEAGFRR